jgi:cytochrome c oxidase subunit 2
MQTHYGLPLGLPPDASAHGLQLDNLTALVHWLMAALFVFWGLFFVVALIRFRRKAHPVASYAGAKGRFSTWGEIGVAIFEVLLLVGFAVPIWARRVSHPPAPGEAVELRVVAEQFAWNVHYPGADGRFGKTAVDLIQTGTNPLGLDHSDPAAHDDVVTLNQLHLPVGKPVLIHLSSKDVIHSFFLPVMRVKQDAIPGQVIPIYFTPTQVTPQEARLPDCILPPGEPRSCWEIACAQLCGLTHYRMQGFLQVETEEEFAAWLAAMLAQAAPAPAPAAAAPAPVPAEPAAAPSHG